MPLPPDDKKERILEALRDGPLSTNTLALRLDTVPDKINRHLRDLVGVGEIVNMTPGKSKNQARVYRLAEKPLSSRILTLLAAGPATTTALGAALFTSQDTLLKALRRLHTGGRVTATASADRRKPMIWSLS